MNPSITVRSILLWKRKKRMNDERWTESTSRARAADGIDLINRSMAESTGHNGAEAMLAGAEGAEASRLR
jgi:hypothetical protein